jgi:MoxR-like ATPase
VKKYVNYGASVRAAQFIVLAAKARALTHKRYHVAYEDITAMAVPVLRHRLLLNFHAESDRIDSDEVLRRLLQAVPPPKGA